MSMITVPETTGVKMRRSRARFAATWKWTSEETTIRLAMSGGPPSSSAATQTAMNAPEVPMMRTCPEPMYPNRTA